MSRRSLSAHDFTAVSTWSCWIWPYRMSSTQLSSYVNMTWGPPTLVHTHPYLVLGVLTDGAPCCSYSNDPYSWRRFFMVTLTVTFPLYISLTTALPHYKIWILNVDMKKTCTSVWTLCPFSLSSSLNGAQLKWCLWNPHPLASLRLDRQPISGNTLNHILNAEPHQQPLTMTAGWEGGVVEVFSNQSDCISLF